MTHWRLCAERQRKKMHIEVYILYVLTETDKDALVCRNDSFEKL